MPLRPFVAVPRDIREWTRWMQDQDIVADTFVDGSIELEKLEDIATDSFLGRDTAGSGSPEVLNASISRTILNVEDGSTADQTDAEIETGYNNQVSAASQAEAEAGTEVEIRRWSPLRIAQAIDALTFSEKGWSFLSPAGASGTFYFGGFYEFHSPSFIVGVGTNVGTANSSYAAHAIVVLGASSTDMVVRVSGTSINDSGVRTTSDTEDIDTTGGSTDDYYETSKKWIGLVVYSLQSGTGISINAGFSKYWDNNNSDYTVTGLEATWLGGANDGGANIELLHHKTTGWTYVGGGTPTPPTAIAGMNADHVTEINVVNGEMGAWKRSNLSQAVSGSGSEGIIWRITTSANKAFELGNLLMTIT